MNVTLNAWYEAAECCWCAKSKEAVNVTFSDSFLTDAPLCWKCLQTAFKVRSRQLARPTDSRAPESTQDSL